MWNIIKALHATLFSLPRTHTALALENLALRLLLFDMGYFHYQLFDCIERNGGYFLTRLKKHANPTIVAVHRRWRGRTVRLVGERLRDVIARLQRKVLDVEVEVRFSRRRYAGRRSGGKARFRLVGVRDEESGEYHLYVTNLPADRIPAATVALTYRARWTVELIFKTLKSGFALEDMPSRKRVVVETLLYASLITFVVSNALLAAVRRRLGEDGRRATDGRWARVLRGYASMILYVITRSPTEGKGLARTIEPAILHEAVDPHRRRIALLELVERGACGYHPETRAA